MRNNGDGWCGCAYSFLLGLLGCLFLSTVLCGGFCLGFSWRPRTETLRVAPGPPPVRHAAQKPQPVQLKVIWSHTPTEREFQVIDELHASLGRIKNYPGAVLRPEILRFVGRVESGESPFHIFQPRPGYTTLWAARCVSVSTGEDAFLFSLAAFEREWVACGGEDECFDDYVISVALHELYHAEDPNLFKPFPSRFEQDAVIEGAAWEHGIKVMRQLIADGRLKSRRHRQDDPYDPMLEAYDRAYARDPSGRAWRQYVAEMYRNSGLY